MIVRMYLVYFMTVILIMLGIASLSFYSLSLDLARQRDALSNSLTAAKSDLETVRTRLDQQLLAFENANRDGMTTVRHLNTERKTSTNLRTSLAQLRTEKTALAGALR